MRKLFIISTTIFWLAVAGFWLADYLRPAAQLTAVTPVAEQPATREYSQAEVARHSLENDCWIAIEAKVYNITDYLPDHPAEPEIILAWCGKEATHAWLTKMRGRPHSSRAENLLHQYLIGNLRGTLNKGQH